VSNDPAAPRSTYRLQLHAECTLDDAAAHSGYLRDLGVSHLYCSPVLQAVPGSRHGYDVVDHSRISDELGGLPAFDRLSTALGDAGLGCVVDIVPNHMDVSSPLNAQWRDVLQHGPGSRYAGWFDIDWDWPGHGGRVLLPLLGDDIDAALSRGDLHVDTKDDEPVLRHYGLVLPLAPGTETGPVDEVLARQHYLLAGWRREATDLNYRRFFDVTSLAGVRVEDPAVFDVTHAVVLDLVAAGAVNGLRIDHPDGFADPAGYLERLHAAAGGAWVVVEKILEPGEVLPADWPVAGTTGYDALAAIGGVFVDPAGERPLTELCADVTGKPTSWTDLVHACKLRALDTNLGSELTRLVRAAMAELPATDETALRAGLRELLAGFPVYRTYLRAGETPSAADRQVLSVAGEEAVRRRPDLAPVLEALLHALTDTARPSELRTRLQQTSGPVMAKGVEDTAFYRYHRLASLNEVGGDPGRFAMTVDEFHAWALRTHRHRPLTMTALSTHDTKRSEDVRARISLLAQCPLEWRATVTRWVTGNARHWAAVEPDRNAEYLLYQTLIGAWPLPAGRAVAYLEKATREAKERTSWTDGDERYDDALRSFVEALAVDEDFQAGLAGFAAPLVWPGRVASLAQKLVQLTMPGVPDVYQGSELWDLSLVDPDNRRPVDFGLRRRLLAELDNLDVEQVLARADDGLPKLLVTSRALRLRGRRPELFGPSGHYQPLAVTGPAQDHVLAFARGGGAVTVVPRLMLRLEGWDDTRVAVPDGDWRDELTGEPVAGGSRRVADLLDRFPIALLSR
jgi:(1->4)-alpha-D-glucan 1-alpha-D-glucosylmutase